MHHGINTEIGEQYEK